MSIRVLLADDQELILDGLRALLEQEPDFDIIGEEKDGREALSAARRLEPDVVVMDIGMPGLDGIEVTRGIAAELPGVKVLILSVHEETDVIRSAFEAGAAGYLLKDCATEELVRGIRVVKEGGSFVSSSIADTVVDTFRPLSSRKR